MYNNKHQTLETLLSFMNKYKLKSMHIVIVLFIALLLNQSNKAYAETINVYVEKASSLVDDSGNPLGIKILQAVEEISDLRFNFTRSTYTRALLNLKDHKADIVLHVPYKVEPGFEEYGIYLDWTVPVKADLYTFDPKIFQDLTKIGNGKIGIPRGNSNFASVMTGIPKEKFYEVNTMNALIKMLVADRVDLIWFDRVSIQQALREQKVHNVFYYEIPKFEKKGSIGIGLQKSKKGRLLKEQLDHLLFQIDIATILEPYYKHLKPELPQAGLINIDNSNLTLGSHE